MTDEELNQRFDTLDQRFNQLQALIIRMHKETRNHIAERISSLAHEVTGVVNKRDDPLEVPESDVFQLKQDMAICKGRLDRLEQ
ncbi:MAG: hypothetical protein QNJ46_14100 [Leptolyngbyaceae cyanobacterium MO_188.B28]|nr:hypothetical protein [Leptolyngbyaceae cyanobacterium MO_188.B28]